MEEDTPDTTEASEVKRSKGIYLLPNLFTTAGLFAGFYAIVAAMGGRFEPAAVAVFIAMIMDGLDGRVARLTNTDASVETCQTQCGGSGVNKCCEPADFAQRGK